MHKLFLLDAFALIYRAHFAFSKNPRINSKGMNTGAVLGFTNTLLDVIKKEQPTHIGVAFDTAEPTFRHIEYKEYKAQREAQPEDITNGLPYIFKIVEALNIPILVKSGYEADDVIGTVAKKVAKTGDFEVFMMTSDKDYAQLVEENIYLYKPAFLGNSIEVLGIPEVLKKFDIERVEQVIDLLGMQGDAVDNIPGIPGVGAKTAVKFLKQFGSVEGLLDNTDQLKGKQKEKVEANKDLALLSKKLVTIDTNVPIDFEIEALKYTDMDSVKIKSLFDELEFRTLKKRLFPEENQDKKTTKSSKKSKTADNQIGLFGGKTETKKAPISESETEISPYNTIANTVHHYYKIDTADLRKRLINLLEKQEEFCFDTETTGIDAHTAELVGLAISTYPKEAYYVPFGDNQEDAKAILQEFKHIFENSNIQKIGQNLKYDIIILKKYGIEVKGKIFDTMLAHYLLEPTQRHNMDVLAENYLHYSPVKIETLIGKKGKNQQSMRDVSVDKVVEYAGEDADITLQLKHKLAPALEKISSNKDVSPQKVFDNVETPLVPVLANMESEGIRLDTDILENISKELHTDLLALTEKIYTVAGQAFNLNSPKQLGEILFDKLKLEDKPKKTKTGQYATGEEILVKLSKKHDIAKDILEFRSLEKLKNTYVDALPKLINPQSQKIHTSYNQAVASTGRLSSTNPNLQNIPIRTEKGRSIRKAFVPRNEDFTLISADYSQIELRIMAAFSQDKTMIEAFQAGRDIHATTASRIFKVPLEEVTSDMRRKAKSANFGIIYGSSAHGLAQNMDIPRKEAGEIIRAYFEEFPAIKQYMEDIVNKAREQGFVETLLGRRLHLANINSRNRVEREGAERVAINAPIQGSAAEMIKLAMIKIHDFIQNKNLQSKMLLQVHDELIFDVYKPEIDTLKLAIEDLMKNAVKLDVPMEIGLGVGENWLEAH